METKDNSIKHPSLGEGLGRLHPSYYQHPSGVECITVARHHSFNIGNALKYLWRAGLKKEEGMSDHQKHIEDLEKAIFYIKDEIEFLKGQKPCNPGAQFESEHKHYGEF